MADAESRIGRVAVGAGVATSPNRGGRGALVAALVVVSAIVLALGSATGAAGDEAVGDPLPSVTRIWDALAADFDRRNGRDIVVTRHDGPSGNHGGIYYADGAGGWTLGFQFPDGDRHGCAAGDVNADGRLDLYCEIGAYNGKGTGGSELWLQRSDGSFVDRAGAWGVRAPYRRGRRPLLYDHNGDGLVDLYFTTRGRRVDARPNANELFINTGTGFVPLTTAATGWQPGSHCVADADWNADGRRDLIVCGDTAGGADTLRLFRNGVTRHTDVSSLLGKPVLWPRDVAAADLNSDGLDDLVVVTATWLEIRLNRGTGKRFATVNAAVRLVDGQRALVRDLNGDGELDVYVSDGCNGSVNVADKLVVGPDWHSVSLTGGPATGCGGEIVYAGRLVVFSGDQAAAGPVTIRDLPLPFG